MRRGDSAPERVGSGSRDPAGAGHREVASEEIDQAGQQVGRVEQPSEKSGPGDGIPQD